jgi:hypothetical protein
VDLPLQVGGISNLKQSDSDPRMTALARAGPLRPTTSNFVFQVNICGYSLYVTSCLTRGCLCRLQLLLVSPAQSFSCPSPAALMTIFYCLRFETSRTWRARSPYLHPPGTGWSGNTPRHSNRVASFVFCIITLHRPTRKHRF